MAPTMTTLLSSVLQRPESHDTHIDVGTLERWLVDGDEIALLDVREHGQYGEGHPFWAVHCAYSRLESEIARLVPRPATRVVVFDDGDTGDDAFGSSLATRAARRLSQAGYTHVHVLGGGAAAWRRSGRTLFKGVNVPSKTFGELAEHAFDVPHLSAADLAIRLRSASPLVLLDGRTLEEHRTMTLPGALPMPNGELALRWAQVVGDDTTPVVVHCAGRTRSIVGAQILRDLGLRNPVFALENGTQGWALAGFELERGSLRSIPPAPATAAALERPQAQARTLLRKTAVRCLTSAQAQAWLDDRERTTFVFDVRTAEEFARGSVSGARHAPGGQLIQATDLQIGVRHARVLLLDEEAVRAPVIALWLCRLGIEAAVVDKGIASGLRIPLQKLLAPLQTAVRSAGAALAALRNERTAVVDLRPSQTYRAGHATGAVWSIRPRLASDLDAITHGDHRRPVLLVAPDNIVAQAAAADAHEAGWTRLFWTTQEELDAAGWAHEATPDVPANAESIDFLFFVHDRHQGNLEAARQYLAWELGLVAQCAPDELASFALAH